MNNALNNQAALTPATPQAKLPNASAEQQAEPTRPIRESWPIIRAILVVWAVAVWLLLVLMPGIGHISDAASAMLHLPHVLIGLALLGAMLAAYSLRSDGHMLWFLGVLLLLAGWM